VAPAEAAWQPRSVLEGRAEAMSKILKGSAIALLALLIAAPAASARGRGFSVRPHYYHFYAYPYLGWGWGWGFGPWYGPYAWGPGYYRYPKTGEVKIETKQKGDSIYVDGGYAGVTGKLKKFRLKPGNHTIELRSPSGQTIYQERVYVIPGKTLKIHADFSG
jgi:hypothetical protein